VRGERISPHQVGIQAEVAENSGDNFGPIDTATFYRVQERMGIRQAHFAESALAAAVPIERDSPKQNATLSVHVEIGKHGVGLQAEAEMTRARRQDRNGADWNLHAGADDQVWRDGRDRTEAFRALPSPPEQIAVPSTFTDFIREPSPPTARLR
jgi:hypothetical protein